MTSHLDFWQVVVIVSLGGFLGLMLYGIYATASEWWRDMRGVLRNQLDAYRFRRNLRRIRRYMQSRRTLDSSRGSR